MRVDNLTRAQMEKIRDTLAPQLKYLNKLLRRMEEKDFPEFDPLYKNSKIAQALSNLSTTGRVRDKAQSDLEGVRDPDAVPAIEWLLCGQDEATAAWQFASCPKSRLLNRPPPSRDKGCSISGPQSQSQTDGFHTLGRI